MTVREEMERLAQKYPEFTGMLVGCVIPGEVIDAEIKGLSKLKEDIENV